MNNKSGSRTLASMAGVAAAGILMAQAAWAVFDSAAVPTGSDLKVARVVPEGDQVPAPGRQIVVTFDRPVVALGSMAVDAARSPVGRRPVGGLPMALARPAFAGLRIECGASPGARHPLYRHGGGRHHGAGWRPTQRCVPLVVLDRYAPRSPAIPSEPGAPPERRWFDWCSISR